MKKRKTILLIFIIIILIIISVLAFIFLKNKKNNDNLQDTNIEKNNQNIVKEINAENENEEYKLDRVTDTDLYFVVDECIKSYMSMLKINNSEILLSYLNDGYVSSKGINKDNVLNTVEKYKDYDNFRTTEMYVKVGNSYDLYYAKGKIDGKYVYFKIGLDRAYETFDITPIDETTYLTDINKSQNEFEIQETIPKKTYNFFRYKAFTDETTAKLYFSDYINLMLTDSEEAYNMLDEEYRKLKYDTIDKFNEYINNNKQNFEIAYRLETSDSTDFDSFSEYYKFTQENSKLGINNYSKKDKDEYTQYTCIDGNNSYYVFNVKYPGDYTVILDKSNN